jgi:CBS domain containing-hemolysin-like protein
LHRRSTLFRGGWGPARRSVVVALWTFVIALGVSILSGAALTFLPLIPAFALIMLIVLLGIVFDIIGLAAATATEAPLHARAAKRSAAAKQAIVIIRNAEFVSSVCNDLVGDVCGTVSGAAGAAIIFRLALIRPSIDQNVVSVITVALIAAMTVGGKAAGKGYALDRANDIIYRVALVMVSWQRLVRVALITVSWQTLASRLRDRVATTKEGRPGGQRSNRR